MKYLGVKNNNVSNILSIFHKKIVYVRCVYYISIDGGSGGGGGMKE